MFIRIDTKALFTRERNRSVPSSFQFLERKSRLFTRERNDCVSLFVSVQTGTQSFRSVICAPKWTKGLVMRMSIMGIQKVTTTHTHALRARVLSFRFSDQFCTSSPVHTETERNGTIAYRSTFRITYFSVPLFGTERCYLKRSRVSATPERSTFWNGTIRNRSRVNGALEYLLI